MRSFQHLAQPPSCRTSLFSILAAALHFGGLSSIRNLRMRHAVVTWTHLSRNNNNNNITQETAAQNIKYQLKSSFKNEKTEELKRKPTYRQF